MAPSPLPLTSSARSFSPVAPSASRKPRSSRVWLCSATSSSASRRGYAIDRRFPDVFYIPEDSIFTLRDGFVRWQHDGRTQQLTLHPSAVYVLPSGFRVHLEKQHSGTAWRLIGSRPRGTLCHKPCTVSGGGKSEISKSIAHALLKGPVYVRDYREDMAKVAEIFERDFSSIYKSRPPDARSRRSILSADRTMGSVIRLFTVSPEYTDEHNEWLRRLPQTTRQLLFTVKRYYRPEWGENWREHFTVDRINGFLGHELKFDNEPLVSNYLRVGHDRDGAWRIYKLRPDFCPAEKVQVEDDITASVVLPRSSLNDLDREFKSESVKLVANCETLLFQRPDEAINPGVDHQAEADISSPGTFLSNYEPLTGAQVRALVDHVVEFDRYTDPMKRLLEDFASNGTANNGGVYVVSSSHPRMVNGKPSLNPRYLQKRPDLVAPRATYLAQIAARLERDIPSTRPVHFPVTAVLAGRKNSPPDVAAGLPPLAVYGPIHYQELPELFMECISSLTGKSPATTGFGSEGALTKGPFNALWPIVDLNNALVSAILTGDNGFTTSAGHIGPHFRVDHDVSMLVPEIWCRMRTAERDPRFLMDNGHLEKIEDFTFDGRTVLASRLGYRITMAFVDHFLGRIFETPDSVFPDGDVAAGIAGFGNVFRGRGRHRRIAAASRHELFRGRQLRGRVPASARSARNHGAWFLLWYGSGPSGSARHVHARGPARKRLVQRAPACEAAARCRAMDPPHPCARTVPRHRARISAAGRN